MFVIALARNVSRRVLGLPHLLGQPQPPRVQSGVPALKTSRPWNPLEVTSTLFGGTGVGVGTEAGSPAGLAAGELLGAGALAMPASVVGVEDGDILSGNSNGKNSFVDRIPQWVGGWGSGSGPGPGVWR